jgi:2-dehydropantoate 2-reductase
MANKARIAVFGAGLIGVYVGGRLAAGGADVTLIGRPRVIDDLRAHGLKLTALDGYDATATPRLETDATELADADLVILAVKSPATEDAAREIAAHAKPGAVVLSLQNGVSNAARIAALCPQQQVVAGMVPYNVAQPGPGHYHQGTGGGLKSADDAAIRPFVPAFAAAGQPLDFQADMDSVLWGKLVINLNNAVNALSGLPLAKQIAQRDYRRALALCQHEALSLLRRASIKPARVLAVPTTLVPLVMLSPNAVYRRIMARSGTRIDRHARSSMAEDLALGRRTEVDWLNGEVVALAARLGRRAPINAKVVELIRAAENGAPPLAAGDLLAELRSVHSR